MGSTARDVEARITARAQAAERGTNLANDGTLRAANPQAAPITFETGTDVSLDEAGVNSFRKDKLEILSFPADLGKGAQTNGNIPYVLFKIFETRIDSSVPVGDLTTASLVSGANAAYQAFDAVPGAANAVSAVANTVDQFANSVFGSANLGNQGITNRAKNLIKGFALKRNIDQIALAIALFMPDGITTNYDNDYEAISVTATLGNVGFAAQALSAVNGETKDINPFIAEAAAAAAGALLGSDDLKRLGLFATTGRVVNPQLEMIYSSPVLRKFIFDFRLVPKSAAESILIAKIIKSLKFYSAPEIPQGASGRYLIPPAQFELEFYKGDETLNPFLFKTKKCVLSGISIDYAPNGFASFADGAPVETRMQLTFQETAIIDRKAVNEGY